MDTMQGTLLDQITTGSHTLRYIEERNTPVDAGIKCIYDTLQ